jgi:hypothetical protein
METSTRLGFGVQFSGCIIWHLYLARGCRSRLLQAGQLNFVVTVNSTSKNALATVARPVIICFMILGPFHFAHCGTASCPWLSGRLSTFNTRTLYLCSTRDCQDCVTVSCRLQRFHTLPGIAPGRFKICTPVGRFKICTPVHLSLFSHPLH